MTGIELITKERQEQIEKHGRTIDKDVELNKNLQLSDAAAKLCANGMGGYWPTETLPVGWDQNIWDKMTNKSYKDRLIIAGALIAAELDRLNAKAKLIDPTPKQSISHFNEEELKPIDLGILYARKSGAFESILTWMKHDGRLKEWEIELFEKWKNEK